MCDFRRTKDRSQLTIKCHQFESSYLSENKNCPHCSRRDNLNAICRPRWIQADHPLKIVWDMCTIILSLTAGVYTTHAGMRDRCFPHLLNSTCAMKTAVPMLFGFIPGDMLVTFLDLWCVADIVLNFFIQHESKSEVNNAKRSYLKTWFVVDLISMLSWEIIFVQPVFHEKKRLIRKAVDLCKMIPTLKRRWPQLIKLCLVMRASRCKPLSLCRLIRYAPKYITFTMKMKVVLLLRIMRHIRLQRQLYKNLARLCLRTGVPGDCRTNHAVAPAA